MAANEVSITITSKNRVKGGFEEAKRDAESEGSKIEQIWGKHMDAISKKMDSVPLKLKLLPAAIAGAGGLLPAVAAIGTSFAGAAVTAGVFGKMASSVLSNAGQDATKLADLQAKLADATTAKQKKAIDQQIANLENGWGKSYSQLVTVTGQVQKKWQDTSRAITAPVLVPWLDAVSHAMDHLKPLVQPIADLFKHWGESIDRYFKSKAGSDELNRIATALGKFGAQQMADIGSFVMNVGRGIASLAKDAGGVNFGAFGDALVKMGTAFAGWAKSDKARQDVGKFMAWMHDNGGLVKQILGDLAKTLPNLFTGLGKAGTSELSAITGFFNLIAGLPPWMQKWVGEGLALFVVSNKAMPVISAATTLVTKTIALMKTPPSWLGGGKAAAGGGAAAGAEGAAGGAAVSGSALAGFAAAGAAIAAGIILKVREDLKKGFTGIIKDIPNWFNFGTLGFIAQSAQGWADLIVSKLRHSFMSWEDDVRHFIAGSWDQTRHDAAHYWDNIISFLSGSWSKLQQNARSAFDGTRHAIATAWDNARHDTANIWDNIRHDVSSKFDNIRHDAATKFANIRHDISNAWDQVRHDASSAWDKIFTTVKTTAGNIVNWVAGLPAKFVKALSHLPGDLGGVASIAFTNMWNGFKNVGGQIVTWISNFFSGVVRTIKKILGIKSPSSVFYDIGVNMMKGLEGGIKASATNAAAHAVNNAKQQVSKSSGGGVSGSGPVGGDAATNKALARKMFPWPASMWSSYDYLEMREAGYNRFARNPSSGAYGIPQALPPTKMPYAAQAAGGSHAGPQISWMYDYIRSRYGNPVNAAAHERNYNWYAAGGATSPGWAVLGERGRELVKLPGGAQVYPHGETEAMLGQGGTMTIQLEIGGGSQSDFDKFLLHWMRENVRVKGGGNVQKAFGRS